MPPTTLFTYTMSDLPESCEKRTDENGEAYFIDTQTGEWYRVTAKQHKRIDTNEKLSIITAESKQAFDDQKKQMDLGVHTSDNDNNQSVNNTKPEQEKQMPPTWEELKNEFDDEHGDGGKSDIDTSDDNNESNGNIQLTKPSQPSMNAPKPMLQPNVHPVDLILNKKDTDIHHHDVKWVIGNLSNTNFVETLQDITGMDEVDVIQIFRFLQKFDVSSNKKIQLKIVSELSRKFREILTWKTVNAAITDEYKINYEQLIIKLN
eukprot:440372_1